MRIKTRVQAVSLVAVILSCSGCHGGTRAVPAPASPSRFLPGRVVVRGETHRFAVYLPLGYTPAHLWPVVVSLHGAGECGSDGMKPSEAGIGEALRQFPERFPCIVVFPQTAHALRYWTDDQDMVLAETAQAVQQFHGDRRRLYLTGYSLGGSGTWFLAARHPGTFAAIAPICGRIAIKPERARDPEVYQWAASPDPFAATARHIGQLPVWVFHGTDDPTVPVTESRRMVSALRACGANIRYTELPRVGHASWVHAYADPALPPWLLSHRLPQ